jgi:hypothetical protein
VMTGTTKRPLFDILLSVSVLLVVFGFGEKTFSLLKFNLSLTLG